MKNALHPVTLLSSVLTLTFALAPIANARERLPLDAHLHHRMEHETGGDSDGHYTYRDALRFDEFETSFLISDSFSIGVSPARLALVADEFKADLQPERVEARVAVSDARVSQITQEYPGRFVGLCGLDLDWSTQDTVRRVTSCINMPGMQGLKMYTAIVEPDTALRDSYEKVDLALAAIESKRPVILWHVFYRNDDHLEVCKRLPSQGPVSGCDAQDLRFVYAMAKKYPNAIFLLAHSTYEAKYINYLAQVETDSGERLNNLFLDTSATDSEIVSAWRQFGMTRVVYGTDNIHQFRPSTEILKNQFGLTETEINQIQSENPRRLLRLMGLGN